MNNSVIIASTAGLLIETLGEKLRDINYRVYVVNNKNELYNKINNTFPRLIFIENCFYGHDTDNYIHNIIKFNQNLHIVIWTVSEMKPDIAARFIHAGAESFFSLRDTGENIEKILMKISGGSFYRPKDVAAVLDNENSPPVFGLPFTDREIQVIKLFGNKDKEIAAMLSISRHTVIYHKTNIYKKSGLKRKNEVLDYVIKNKIIRPEELL